MNSRSLRTVSQVIQESFSDPGFNISQLADQANLSLPYLSTVFKQAMGQTISSYLSRQRLLCAQKTAAGHLDSYQRCVCTVRIRRSALFCKIL